MTKKRKERKNEKMPIYAQIDKRKKKVGTNTPSCKKVVKEGKNISSLLRKEYD